jgi:apolipoprotein N-acyltransferase
MSAELSMWLQSIIALGSESLLEPHFSVTSLGYALSENPHLLQFADSGGIAALNFIVAAIAVILFLVFETIRRRKETVLASTYVCIGLVLLLLMSSRYMPYTLTQASEQTTSVLVFSADSARSGDKYESMRPYILQTLQSLSSIPNLIVFPEGYSTDKLFGNETERQTLYDNLFGDKEALLVYTKLNAAHGVFNTLYFESTKHGIVHEVEKRYLAPEGEYMTYLGKFLIALIPDPLLQKFANRNQHIRKGSPPTPARIGALVVGGLSCYEIFSPTLYRSLVENHGANVLINTSDPTWFHDSPLYFFKTLQMARVHAVQNRTPFIAANKGTTSYIVDGNGHLHSITKWDRADFLYATISVRTQ